MTRKETILVTIFIFLLLFRPTVLPIDLIYPLTAFSIVMLIMYARRSQAYSILWLRKIFNNRYFIAIASICIVSLIGFLYNWHLDGLSIAEAIKPYLMGLARFGVTFLLLPINLAWLLVYSKRKNFASGSLMQAVFYAIVIQLVFVIAAYLLPPVKDAIIWLMQINGNWTERWTENRPDEYRMFGFAKSLFDTFGFGLGILSAVPWIIAYRRKNLSYLLILPLIFFAVFINARTGLVIMGVTTLTFLIFYSLNWRNFLNETGKISRQNKRTLLAICVMTIVASVGIASFINRGGYLSTIIWRDIGGYVRFIASGGDITETYGTQAHINLSGEWWTVPERPDQLLIGAGQSVYGSDSTQGFSSDVGYINNIWILGVLGTIVLHSVLFYTMWKYTSRKYLGRTFAILSIVSILLFQVKGSAFWSANLGIASIILIYSIYYYEEHIQKRDSVT